MLQLLNEIFSWIGSNIIIVGISSTITIIGFIITVFILIQTKYIDQRIKEFKTTKKYNKRRIELRKTLLEYREAITKDEVDIIKIKGNILDELNVLKENFHKEFKVIQNLNIKFLIIHLEKNDRHNRNFICNTLSRIASYLKEKKEEAI